MKKLRARPWKTDVLNSIFGLRLKPHVTPREITTYGSYANIRNGVSTSFEWKLLWIVVRRAFAVSADSDGWVHCIKLNWPWLPWVYFSGNFDLQAVLYRPLFLGKPLFYKRNKSATFNFTIFDTAKKEGHCFLWQETEGNRGGLEILSSEHQISGIRTYKYGVRFDARARRTIEQASKWAKICVPEDWSNVIRMTKNVANHTQ